MRPRQLFYPRNPAYGTGLCRRIVRVSRLPWRVETHLSDTFHEMRCTVRHDSRTVIAIEGKTIRIPTSACPGAAVMLQTLVGTPLTIQKQEFYRDRKALQHCTHLYDLAVLAIGNAMSPFGSTCFEAIVPDETDAPVNVVILQDDHVVHSWHVRDGTILDPLHLRGKTLDKGFAQWAAATFTGEALDAATILARTWLIAIGRRFSIDAVADQAIVANEEMIGRCFAYQPDRAATASFIAGQTKDSDDLLNEPTFPSS